MIIIFNIKGLIMGLLAVLAALATSAVTYTLLSPIVPKSDMGAANVMWAETTVFLLTASAVAIALDRYVRRKGQGGGALFFIPVFVWGIVLGTVGIFFLVMAVGLALSS